MPSTEHIPGLGDLNIVETFIYYDRPRLFVARGEAGALYLVVWLEELDHADEWLYAPISPRRLKSLRARELTVRKAFEDAEGGIVYRVVTPTSGGSPEVRQVESAALTDEMLPARGRFLPVTSGAEAAQHRRKGSPRRHGSGAGDGRHAYFKAPRDRGSFLIETRPSSTPNPRFAVPEKAFWIFVDLLSAADRALSFDELYQEASKGFERQPPIYWFRVVLRLLRQMGLVTAIRGAYAARHNASLRSDARALWENLPAAA